MSQMFGYPLVIKDHWYKSPLRYLKSLLVVVWTVSLTINKIKDKDALFEPLREVNRKTCYSVCLASCVLKNYKDFLSH